MDELNRTIPESSELAGFTAPTWTPHSYQNRGIDRLCNTEAALFLPPGLGKTSITLAAFLKLKSLGLVKRMLVMAPLRVCQAVWKQEAQKWAQFQGLRFGLAHGPDKMRVLVDPQYDIVLLNYDGIQWAVPILEKVMPYDIVCFDELTALKNTNSKRYKLIKPVLPRFKFRWGLTGTPAANGLHDLFGQVYCLDLGKRLGRFVTHFRLKYFYQKPWDQFGWHITPEKAEELTDTLRDLAMYVDPEDWLTLPEFLPIRREVPMPKELRAKYDFLEKELVLRAAGTVITVPNTGGLTSKLRQFTGGNIYDADGNIQHIHNEKLEALEDLVEEMAGEPLMVAYQFDHERAAIMKRFPNALVLKGAMSTKQASDVIEQWSTGEEPLLLVQPASASKGLNLQFGGSAICWYTMTYNLEDYIQLNKRLHRQGQKKAVRCYLLAMEGTIDDAVAAVLADKNATQEDLFKALKLHCAPA